MKPPDQWAVWNLKRSPCCGVHRAHVYPADLEQIECECGAWIPTPLGERLRLKEAQN